MISDIHGLLRNRLVWLAAAVVVGVAGWYFFLAKAGSGNLTYETQAVDRGNVETSVASSGAVSPLLTITVGSEVSGKLTDVVVDFNSKVTKGQKLAQIDPSTFSSKVQSAQADLVVAQATMGAREVDVSTAQVSLDQAKRDRERADQLLAKGLISQNDFEKARNVFEQAQNAVKIAQANLNNARSQIVKVKATLEQAQIDLRRTQILSPVDGVVISRKVDAGQTVQASMQAPELFQIARDLTQVQIETKVGEADIGSIKEGARATFTVDAYPDRSFEGTVAQVRINGTTLQNVVTYSVMVQAANPNLILLPGMTANVKILTAERTGVLRIPSAALRFRPPTAGDAAGAPVAGARAAGGAAGGGAPGGDGGGGGRGGVRMTPEVMKEIGLTAEQQAKVTEALAALRQRQTPATATNPLGGAPFGGGPGGFGGGNNNANAALMRQRMQNALASVLTDEQMLKYQALGANNTVRNASIWVLDAKGKPVSKEIRIGLQTDSQTEVVSGLAAGDKVVVRARAAKPA